MSKSNQMVGATAPNRQTRADLTQSNSALVAKILSDPSVFPDEFTAWIPRWLARNVNFKVGAGQLPLLEAVKLVGGNGQPLFENSWANFGGSDDKAGFYKDTWGIVHLTGTVKSGTLNSRIWTMPAGYRPQYINNFAVVCNSAFGQVKVLPTGDVTMVAGGSNTYLTLSGISYRAFS